MEYKDLNKLSIDELEDQIQDWKENGAEEHIWLPKMNVEERWNFTFGIFKMR